MEDKSKEYEQLKPYERGDGINKRRARVQKEIREHLESIDPENRRLSTEELFRRYESNTVYLRDLMIEDSFFMEGDLSELFPGIDEKDVDLFLYRSRVNFMKDYKHFLNILATPAVYAEFKGVTRQAISEQLSAGRFDVVEICERKFILPGIKEIWEFNKFLMARVLRREKLTSGNEEKKYLMLLNVYESVYGETVERDDSVKEWIESCGMVTVGANHASKQKVEMANAYTAYCKWAKCEDYEPVMGMGVQRGDRGKKSEPVTRNEFSKRIGEMGFKRFNAGFRGFYFYFKDDAAMRNLWVIPRKQIKRTSGIVEQGSVDSVGSLEEYKRLIAENRGK